MRYIERNASEFAALLKPLNYRKRTVSVVATESVTLDDLNWSGGTRSEYHAFRITGEALGNSLHFSKLAPWDNFAEGKRVSLPEGAVMVRTGYFCGKPSLATIYVHPANMPRLIASEVQS